MGQRSGMTPDRHAPYPQPVNFAPTSASAREAHASGLLAQWSQAFLRGEGGNLGVAEPLHQRDDDVYVLAEVDLDDVYPISGPDQGFDWPVPPAEFERRIKSMVQMFDDGWDAPPCSSICIRSALSTGSTGGRPCSAFGAGRTGP